MDEEAINVKNLFAKCKCCLGDGDLKNLWGEYIWNGLLEVYGEMLSECFDITLSQNVEETHDSHLEQICDSCIYRLRDALDFKREVLACEQLRYEYINKIRVNEDSKENESQRERREKEENCEEDLDNYSNAYTTEMDDMESYQTNNSDRDQSEEIQDFQDVEYLEIDEDKEDYTADNRPDTGSTQEYIESLQTHNNQIVTSSSPSRTPEIQSDASIQEKPKRKWPKKRRGLDRIYKKYTREAMLKAVEAVRNGYMSKMQASTKYNVPMKTLGSWLANASDKITEKELSYYNFVDEVKIILTYTNAVPFKTKSARYFCAYCSTDGPFFEDPDDLRVHTRTKHVDDRMKNTEIILRPKHQNETLKIDIDSLQCTVCCIILPSWSSMFKHLEETHNIKLNEAYAKVIPYVLKRDLKCALCSEPFSNFHNLDGHMNSHYSTYICQDCGDTFLSAIRLDKHVKVHMTGRYPCEECGKVFTLDKYRQKHYGHVHKQEHNVKCLYCPEKFYGMFQRHLHVVEKHKEKVRTITCEYCGLRFDWKPYYIAHLHKKHKIKK